MIEYAYKAEGDDPMEPKEKLAFFRELVQSCYAIHFWEYDRGAHSDGVCSQTGAYWHLSAPLRQVLIKRFHKNPGIEAVDILLQERMPKKAIVTKEKKEKIEKLKIKDYENYKETV